MARVKGDLNKLLKNPPKCSRCGKKERVIGVEFGKYIFRCEDCTRESIRKLWEEGV